MKETRKINLMQEVWQVASVVTVPGVTEVDSVLAVLAARTYIKIFTNIFLHNTILKFPNSW